MAMGCRRGGGVELRVMVASLSFGMAVCLLIYLGADGMGGIV